MAEDNVRNLGICRKCNTNLADFLVMQGDPGPHKFVEEGYAEPWCKQCLDEHIKKTNDWLAEGRQRRIDDFRGYLSYTDDENRQEELGEMDDSRL